MNEKHLQLCASDDWADTVTRFIIPWTVGDAALGDELLELGPGPGRTTEVLRGMVPRLTAVEVHAGLAVALAQRLRDTNVRVVHADATRLPFPQGQFSAVLSLTMLHHVPSVAQQDQLMCEALRVLRPNGVFVGTDSLDSEPFRALHEDDICVPLDPAMLQTRLVAAGFAAVAVATNPYAVRFHARKAVPATS